MTTLRQKLLSARPREISIELFGEPLLLREFSRGECAPYDAAMREMNEDRLKALFISLALRDREGQRIFGANDLDQILAWPLGAFAAVWKVINEEFFSVPNFYRQPSDNGKPASA